MPTKKKRKLDKKLDLIFKNLRKSKYFTVTFVLLILIVVFYLTRGVFLAAVVGGSPISRFAVIRELEKQSGQQTLDNLISKELLIQESQRRGVIISEGNIQDEISSISSTVEAQGTTLDAELSLRGQTRRDLEESIRIQKIIEELLKDKINITDEEVENYYQVNKSFFGEDVNFDEIKDDIKEQIRQEKLSQEFSILLEDLKTQSNIHYIHSY